MADSEVMALMVEAMAVNAEVEAMKIANTVRASEGYSPAYGETEFNYAASSLNTIANAIRVASHG